MKSKQTVKKPVKSQSNGDKSPFWFKFDSRKLSKKVDNLEKSVIKGAQKFVVRKWQKVRQARNQIVIWCSLVLTLLLAVGLQIFFSQNTYRTLAMVAGGTYREGVVGEIKTLNPIYATTEAERAAGQLIFSRLYNYDTAGKLKGDLAKSVIVSDDGLVYSVTIHENIKWHDGEPLTAKDVKFTLGLIKNPLVKSSLGDMWNNIAVKQISDYSLEFTLPVAYGPFLTALNFPVLPEHILGQEEAVSLRESNFSNEPVGSGPMKAQSLRSVVLGDNQKQVLHLAVNELYYRAKSQLNRLELHAFADEEDLYRAIENQEINAAAGVTKPNIAGYKDWLYQESELSNGVFAFFNNDRNVLNSSNVRRALRQALDLRSIRSQFNERAGNFRVLDYPLLAEQMGVDKLKPQDWYNPEAAKQVLISQGWSLMEEGWVNSEGRPLELAMVVVKDADYSSLAEMLAQNWRNFGIKVELEVVDLTAPNVDFVRGVLQSRNYDVLVYEIGLGADPDQFAYWHSSQKSANGLNLSNYSNTVSDTLLSTARSQNDLVLRRAKYQSFVDQWLADAPAIGLVQSNFGYAVHKDVQTFDPSVQLVTPTARYHDIDRFMANRRLVYTTP